MPTSLRFSFLAFAAAGMLAACSGSPSDFVTDQDPDPNADDQGRAQPPQPEGSNDEAPPEDTDDVCGNGLDDDGDGRVDEGCPCDPGATQSCYAGDPALAGIGACNYGTQTCLADDLGAGSWGSCSGSGTPSDDVCDGVDNDCDGVADVGCACDPGEQEACGSSVGVCEAGVRTCGADGTWGVCEGAVEPSAETCNGLDDDCDGLVDPGCACVDGDTRPCNLYHDVGACVDGHHECLPDGTWSTCLGAVGPTEEICGDGIDNDCDGSDDDECVITLALRIVGLDNDAMFDNCLYVRIDGGASYFVGCNHDADIEGKELEITLPGPACYEVGFEMSIDDTHTVRTVALGGAEDHRWRVLDQTPIRVEFEDNTDMDYDDFQFSVEMDRNYFGIKNRAIGCQ